MIPKQLEEAIDAYARQVDQHYRMHVDAVDARWALDAAISAHVAERVREAVDARSDDAGKAAGWDQASQDMDDAEVPPASFPSRVRWLIDALAKFVREDETVEDAVKRIAARPHAPRQAGEVLPRLPRMQHERLRARLRSDACGEPAGVAG